ncbi:MAG: proprotein convertase P-domain-containing protein [Planctomycetaceae bacterium]|nr:proprotein convertase P-domain-containing protein [Planctomycetaceae bacterium]
MAEDEPLGTGTPWLDEIQLQLTSPSGTTVTLIDFNTFDSSSAGFRGTITFDQSATLAVDFDTSQLMSGTFRPVGSAIEGLELLNGESAVGEWSLSVADSVGGDGLSFYDASLQVTSVPEPAALWLIFAMGPLALIARYRSSRQFAAQAGPR